MNTKLNSLGFNKEPKDTKIVVAMSGGVDSSTVAGIMKNEGYNVIGITLKLYDDANKSCRWSHALCLKNSEYCEESNSNVPKFIQERAWTSPIWLEQSLDI